jgi:hypothetical protein
MTSGIPLYTLEQAYISVTQGRLSHAEIATHLTLLYRTPRTRKGIIDYTHRSRLKSVS